MAAEVKPLPSLLVPPFEPKKKPWYLLTFDDICPQPFHELFEDRKWRYKVYHGGRGGAKSVSVARVIAFVANLAHIDVLYAREFQNSIDDSSYRDLVAAIDDLGLNERYDIGKTTITNLHTGSVFRFLGLRHNLQSIKSKSNFDICIVEEAESVSAEAWDTLDPTIRKPNSEIWAIFNAKDPDGATYRRFVLKPPPNAFVRKINYDENPHFPDVLRKQMEHCRATDPDRYAHVWLGFPKMVSDAQILRGKWVIDELTPCADGKIKKGWDGPYFGVDWGFSVDPSAMVKCWRNESEGRLYIEYEVGGVGIELDDLPTTFDKIPESRKHTIRADSARPETISHMRNKGYPKMLSVQKWSGSVEDGIEHLRSYKQIVIHPRCKEVQTECRLYSYKVTKAGDITTDVQDLNNHYIDAIRYALAPLITRKGNAKILNLKV